MGQATETIQCRPTRKKHLFQLRLKSYCRMHSELNFLRRRFLVFPDENCAISYFRHFLFFHACKLHNFLS